MSCNCCNGNSSHAHNSHNPNSVPWHAHNDPCDPNPCHKCKRNHQWHKYHHECSNPEAFTATLKGSNDVPPNKSDATGKLVSLLATDELRLDFILQTNDLTNIVAAHFHHAPAGSNGPIVKTITIDPLTNGSVGSWTSTDVEPLTPALVAALKAGNIYVNVHTTQFPAGEIRGQVHAKHGHESHCHH